ncbi:MAG TPA: alanine--tRNA ligase-related protein [Candidatus Saccharimonadales bacterium]|nr:alanine--tRNA ligase-related protein [Candidatus Saccharimonadales bacterium]
MNAQQIRNAYLDFFKQRQHAVIPRALLVPQNDPTTLFTGSGMQPMIPYLLGEEHPEGTRIVDSQTCLRAQDIDEVGDNRHTTFFEMLGNWSLGDYFKKEQVPWMFEFLTEVVSLDASKLYITCFIGAPEYDIPKDTEVAEMWAKLFEAKGLSTGITDIGSEEDGYKRGVKPGERIFYYDGSKNWWNRGKTGPDTTPIGDPCGPDSEMFYDFGDNGTHVTWVDGLVARKKPSETEEEIRAAYRHCHPNCDCGRFMEIGNNVFMAYRKEAEGKFVPLEKPNIDHGSGLERIAAAANDEPDAFKISLLWPIIEKLEALSGKAYDSNTNAMRIIADHLRAATFLAVDGIVPSNKEQGYVMRRLVRRAIMKSFNLGIEQNFLEQLVPVIADLYHADFPEVAAKRDTVIAVLVKEEKVFRQTLRKGKNELLKMAYPEDGTHQIIDAKDNVLASESYRLQIDGRIVFTLYDTYGFPIELTEEEAMTNGIIMQPGWRDSFQTYMNAQRQRSQGAAKGVFKGGLGGQTLQHKKYHTATHLMYQALRQVLGSHVIQRGSNITEDRLRFDFSHDEKMTPEQIKQVEDIVNEQIAKDLPVFWKEYPTKDALAMGALGAFGDRYGDVVKIYQMGEGENRFSFEICGGPHVDRTSQLAEDDKHFKIVKEEASSAGIRRIKAVLQ